MVNKVKYILMGLIENWYGACHKKNYIYTYYYHNKENSTMNIVLYDWGKKDGCM